MKYTINRSLMVLVMLFSVASTHAVDRGFIERSLHVAIINGNMSAINELETKHLAIMQSIKPLPLLQRWASLIHEGHSKRNKDVFVWLRKKGENLSDENERNKFEDEMVVLTINNVNRGNRQAFIASLHKALTE